MARGGEDEFIPHREGFNQRLSHFRDKVSQYEKSWTHGTGSE